MTLELLKPLLPHYNAKGAVLTVLALGGAMGHGELLSLVGCPKRTLCDALAALQSVGLVRKTAPDGAENRTKYEIVGAENRTMEVRKTAPDGAENRTKLTRKKRGAEAEKRAPDGEKSVEDSGKEKGRNEGNKEKQNVPSFKSLSIKAVKELKDKKINKEGGNFSYKAESEEAIPEGLRSVWVDFLEMRRARRFPVNQAWAERTGIKLQDWVRRYGVDAAKAAVEYSTGNQYQGLFEERCKVPGRVPGGRGRVWADVRAQSTYERVLEAVGGSDDQ